MLGFYVYVVVVDTPPLHCIPTEYLQGDVFKWLRQFKEMGLIKEFGVSIETVEDGLLCILYSGNTTVISVF
ncbi:MAG: hypothetical protein HQL32_16580 [Planctomycetes bacterium]|nr:hypothetical protein [Planctomycetota bacterium]